MTVFGVVGAACHPEGGACCPWHVTDARLLGGQDVGFSSGSLSREEMAGEVSAQRPHPGSWSLGGVSKPPCPHVCKSVGI